MEGALAPLVRPLAVVARGCDDRWLRAEPVGATLILAAATMGRDELARIALGAVGLRGMAAGSRSATAGWRGVLVAAGGAVGLDIEALERVALNAAPDDAWLAPAERLLVERSAEPVLELACHWVLKEAYGKAMGVGLALPLDALAFGARAGAIVLAGVRDWSFGLHRHADVVIATARQIPFAPVGRKPPTPLLDR